MSTYIRGTERDDFINASADREGAHIDGLGGCDQIFGTDFDDEVHGGAGDDVIFGGRGNDEIWGEDGDDLIFGGNDDDLIKGGAGADTMYGNSGVDTATYYDFWMGVIVSLTSGIGMGGDASGDILTSIENLQGSHWHDTLAGDPNDNKLDGLDGNDVLLGGGGADTLLGGAGFDTLYGGVGADTLDGGANDDILDGGLNSGGYESLTGGPGSDIFVFRNGNSPIIGAGAGDTITDFTLAFDIIDLSAMDADVNTDGDQAFMVVGAFTGQAGQLVFDNLTINGQNYTTINTDWNGDGQTDDAIAVTIAGSNAFLSASDMIL